MQFSRKLRSLKETSVIFFSLNVCCLSEWDLVSHLANVFLKKLKCCAKLIVGNSLPKTQPVSIFSVFVTVAKTRKSIRIIPSRNVVSDISLEYSEISGNL